MVASVKPVWVILDKLCVRGPGQPEHVNGAGVDITGEVEGELLHWVPTVKGDNFRRNNISRIANRRRSGVPRRM